MKLLPTICAASLLMVAAVACKKTSPTTSNYADAINNYYQAHPACLWSEEKKFPVQAATSDDAKTQGYDALVDQGLLTRTVSEKKIVIVSKRENNYDLSDKGRAAWTADPNQPGYGNFCYGHLKASNVTQVSTNGPTDQPGSTVQVSYVPRLDGAPAWATAPETQTAFPQIASALNNQQAVTATLTNTSNGWQVSRIPPLGSNAAGPADGRIVQ
ncbi:MAG TPA: hypothetical protein VJU82_04040 [Acidobacteriaceae bacterium]|nr:hypothetical protein [Acidobacteriaceae bacterium]